MPQYMLLLHEDPTGWAKLSPEEMQTAIEKYMAWAKKPINRGGKRLTEEPGKVIRYTPDGPRVTDGPYSETKEMMGGFYTIEAASYEEAVQLSMDHPHLEHGTIEVRQIFEM